MNNTLKQHLKKLRLSGLLSSLEVRLHEAEANRLPYAEFLELLIAISGRSYRVQPNPKSSTLKPAR